MKGRKLLAGFLSAAMVLGTMAFPVFAANETYTVDATHTLESVISEINTSASGNVVINLNADANFSFGARTQIGNENTTSITIDGGNNVLNLIGTDTDWSSLGNAGGKLVFKNVTINKTEGGNGAWNNHAFNITSYVEFDKVTVNNAVTIHGGGKFTNTNFYEAGEYYTLYIPAVDQDVVIENCNFEATNSGRGIKVIEQYVSEAEKAPVDITVTGSTFKTAKKAAILVTSTEGANITASENTISDVAADSTHLVWVDSDLPASYPKVNVTIDGEPVAPYLEDAGTGVACIGNSYYMTLADALDAAEGEIVLIQDVAMNGLNVATDKNVVINLNNKKLTLDGTQNTIAGSLTVKNGEIDITDSHCSANGIFYVTGALNLENVDFTGEEYSSAYGVIYANEGGVVTIADSSFALKNELYSAGGVLKGNAITTATFNITDTTFSLENPCSVIRNATVALDGVTIDAKITDLNLGVGDLRNHAFRNMVGSVENSTIAADGFETGIKNDTGALIVDNSTITLKNSYNGANLVISGEDKLSLKTGYYSFNPIKYLADGYSVLESDKTGFFKVGETPAVPETVPETKVDVKDPTVIVPEDSGITKEALKTAVKSVATQESLQSATAVAVQKDETLVGTVDNAKEELERENIAVDNETVTVIVKPYLEVKVLTVETGSITLNIVPKCDVIATTAEENEAVNTEGTEKNAVVLEEGKTLEVVTPMTITIALPADFASVGGTIYINHVKDDGSTYIYDAVVGGTTDALTATFTNPNGFSTFTATTTSEAVVKIGDIGYKTLEEAVGKVKADETIVLLVNNAEEVTVARDISFILDKDSNEFTGSISAGDNTTVTTSDDGEKTTYSFDYTAPSIPVGSGGTGAVSFIVDFRTNGGSIVSSVKVKKGEKVIRPEDPTKEGYTFGGWFTDEALKKEYDFDTKVQKKLVLYAKWIEEAAVEPEPELPVFTDVKETDWFYESVMTAFKKGLMNGVSETEFAPDTTLTRAMLVTILYRAEGEPATNRSIPFADIEMGSYYANAVIWAAQNGIVNGTTETTFAPDSNITREQVAAILYRYAIYKGMDAVDLSENLNFADSDDVSEYAISALNWATGCGLVTGYEDNTLRPLANTTRAEAATLLQRFIETDK